MVTFVFFLLFNPNIQQVCYYCNSTLKKKQLDQHILRCRQQPSRFSCLDCSKEFIGKEYQAHTSCRSEAEQYHGQFYKPKQTKTNIVDTKQEEKNNEQEKKEASNQDKNNKQEATNWKGWKKTIRKCLQKEPNQMCETNSLRKFIVKQYLATHPDADESSAQEMFEIRVDLNN